MEYNNLAEALNLGTLFSSNKYRIDFLSINYEIKSWFRYTKPNHPLLKNVQKLAEKINFGYGNIVESDTLNRRLQNSNLVNPVAFKDNELLAIGEFNFTHNAIQRKAIADAGIHRFYTILIDDQDMFTYLMNCFVFLQKN